MSHLKPTLFEKKKKKIIYVHLLFCITSYTFIFLILTEVTAQILWTFIGSELLLYFFFVIPFVFL